MLYFIWNFMSGVFPYYKTVKSCLISFPCCQIWNFVTTTHLHVLFRKTDHFIVCSLLVAGLCDIPLVVSPLNILRFVSSGLCSYFIVSGNTLVMVRAPCHLQLWCSYTDPMVQWNQGIKNCTYCKKFLREATKILIHFKLHMKFCVKLFGVWILNYKWNIIIVCLDLFYSFYLKSLSLKVGCVYAPFILLSFLQ